MAWNYVLRLSQGLYHVLLSWRTYLTLLKTDHLNLSNINVKGFPSFLRFDFYFSNTAEDVIFAKCSDMQDGTGFMLRLLHCRKIVVLPRRFRVNYVIVNTVGQFGARWYRILCIHTPGWYLHLVESTLLLGEIPWGLGMRLMTPPCKNLLSRNLA
jgi:hypothetical protein